MKKTILLVAFSFTLFACGGKTKKVNTGMTKEQVVKILGNPKEKTELFGNAIWMYEDKMIAFQNDTVSKVNSKEDLKKATQELFKTK